MKANVHTVCIIAIILLVCLPNLGYGNYVYFEPCGASPNTNYAGFRAGMCFFNQNYHRFNCSGHYATFEICSSECSTCYVVLNYTLNKCMGNNYKVTCNEGMPLPKKTALQDNVYYDIACREWPHVVLGTYVDACWSELNATYRISYDVDNQTSSLFQCLDEQCEDCQLERTDPLNTCIMEDDWCFERIYNNETAPADTNPNHNDITSISLTRNTGESHTLDIHKVNGNEKRMALLNKLLLGWCVGLVLQRIITM